MGIEGEFAIGLQRALEDIFRSHERSVEGLHKNNRRLLAEIQKLRAGLDESKRQLNQLYVQNQRLQADKEMLEAERHRRGK